MADRLVVSLAEDTTQAIDAIARRKNVTRTEIVKRALAFYMTLDEEISENPKKRRLAIAEGDKIIERILFS